MKGKLLAISYPLFNWVEKVQTEIGSNESLQAIIQKIQDHPDEATHYTFADGLLRYKNKVVYVPNSELR